jgi:hypothetical protein
VLLNAASIDGRYPSTLDNLAWLELLGRYQPAGFSGDYLALHKALDPAPVHSAKILERTLTWGRISNLTPHPQVRSGRRSTSRFNRSAV